jgi:hypothetical protein
MIRREEDSWWTVTLLKYKSCLHRNDLPQLSKASLKPRMNEYLPRETRSDRPTDRSVVPHRAPIYKWPTHSTVLPRAAATNDSHIHHPQVPFSFFLFFWRSLPCTITYRTVTYCRYLYPIILRTGPPRSRPALTRTRTMGARTPQKKKKKKKNQNPAPHQNK